MTATKALTGLTPSRIQGSGANTTGATEYPVSTGYSSNIFTGDIVKIVGGYCRVITSTEDFARGVFVGCRYEQDGSQKFSRYWPANTSATNAFAMVVDENTATFIVQADASLSIGDINSQNFSVTLGAGSTYTGKSGFGLKAAGRSTGVAMLRPISVWNVPGNNITIGADQAYPIVEVRIVQNDQKFMSIVTSTGALADPTSTTY